MQAKSQGSTLRKKRNDKRPLKPGGKNEPVHYPTLHNKPGEMVWLPKGDLKVDKTYQRPVNPRAVARIAANWNWIACGVLIVSFRTNGEGHYIVDGQHRWEAGKLNDDVTNLPCLAFEINDIKDEASGFLAANTERQIPLMLHRFKALVTIKDRHALIADELIRTSGRSLKAPASKTNIMCIGDLMRCVRLDRTTIYRVWPLIVELTQDHPLPGSIIKGVFYLERKLPSGYSLTDNRTRTRILQVGLHTINASINEVANFEGKRNERTCAMGVLRAINKGLRNQIKINLD